ncbi:MAG TPA: hypothetical protein ENH80_15590 [Phycisphaerae bacterium]|nr:hypothetical protein [Phycisphaerae bacterium]
MIPRLGVAVADFRHLPFATLVRPRLDLHVFADDEVGPARLEQQLRRLEAVAVVIDVPEYLRPHRDAQQARGQQVAVGHLADQGLDGSKVLVHRSNYGTQSPGTHLPIDEMLSHNSAFNFRGGDFMPAEETLPVFLREANDPEVAAKFEGAKTPWNWDVLKSPAGSCQHIIATSEQFYRAIENDPDLPTIQSESWLGFWDGCYETRARSRQISRRVECQLLTAEAISSGATLAGLPSALEDIREAWYGLLISHHHDPQLAVMGPYEIFEVMQRNMDSGRWAKRIIDRSTKFLTDRIATDAQPGTPVVVFNPVAWQASSVVEIDADATGDVRVVDPAGNEAPLQIVSDADGNTSLAFLAGEMPGAGWRTYYVQAGQASGAAMGVSVSEECIENEHVRVELADGLVQKIIETTTGKCLFAANDTAAVNELFVWDDEGCPAQIRPYDFMNTAKLLTRSSQVDRDVCVSEAGPARAAVDVSFAMEWGTFRQRIILQAGAPWVDFETHVEWFPEAEGGRRIRAAFPWAAGDAKVRRDIPFGVIDWEPTDTIIPTNSWLGLADEQETVGAAMIHDGTCSQQVRDNLMWQTLFRSTRVPGDIKDDKPDPPCGWDVSGDTALEEGAGIYRQRLVVHTGTWQQAAVPQRALEFTMPMSTVAADRHGGELAGEKSDLAVEGDGLVVCAWKQSDFTDGTVVRVYNTTGQAVSGALTLGFDVSEADETNFREEHTGALTIQDGRIALEFGPYEIKTVRLAAR